MLKGSLHAFVIESRALRDNALGDPCQREVYVYLPPGFQGGPANQGPPLVLVLAGFTGVGGGQLRGTPWEPSFPQRYEALLAAGHAEPCAFAFPDAFTRYGGSQYMNSPATGRYEDYLLEELLPAVEQRFGVGGRRARRGVMGKSSGGYGALCLGRDRPDVFGSLGVHAGDACFEYCYLPDLPKAAAALLGSDPAAWLDALKRRARETKLGGADHPVLNVLAMAAHYSPRASAPLGLELPFEPETARLRPEIWERWLSHDPVRFVPRAGDAYRRLGGVYLDCGTRDEFHLRWGTRMVAEALRAHGVPLQHDEFEDGHMGTSYRFEASLRWIAPQLAPR